MNSQEQRKLYEDEKEKIQELFTAVSVGSVPRLKKFVAEELNGNYVPLLAYKDANGRTPLHFAAHAGREEICGILVKECDPECSKLIDRDGYTPWALAIRSGQLECLKILIEGRQIEIDKSLKPIHLFDAASCGNVDLMKYLLDLLTDKSILNEQRQVGTALHGAVFSKSVDVVKLLVENGSVVDSVDSDNVTPLIVACTQGSKDIVAFLLASGADTSHLTKHNTNCYHAAASVGADDTLSILMDASTKELNMKDNQGFRPIELAALHNHDSTVELLFTKTADIEYESPEELIQAIKRERAETLIDLKSQSLQVVKACSKFKEKGNEFFNKKTYIEAIDEYTKGIHAGEEFLKELEKHKILAEGVIEEHKLELSKNSVAPLYSNRCMSLFQSKRIDAALKDAQRAIELAPKWPKARYRLGQCYTAQEKYPEAGKQNVVLKTKRIILIPSAQAYWDGYQLAPKETGADALFRLFKASVKLGKQQVQANEKAEVIDAKVITYSKEIPIEVPLDASGQNFRTIMLKYNNSESPAEIAGRFIKENKLDVSLIPRVAHHVNTIMQQERKDKT